MAIDGRHVKFYPGSRNILFTGPGDVPYLPDPQLWVLTQLDLCLWGAGLAGDLILAPQLVKEEFNKRGCPVLSVHSRASA